MIKQFLEFGFVIALVIFLGSCEKATIPSPQVNWQAHTGYWENVNAFADNIDRIIITRKEIGRISVELWSSCGMEVCNLGLFSYSESDLNTSTLPINILWNNQEWPLSLGMTESGKLELRAMDNNAAAFETQYFSWIQTPSFYQQITQEDARNVQLTGTRIIGGPKDPDNQLTSGSILIFQTNEGRLGKIQVHGNDVILSLRWQTWAPDGTVYRSSNYFPVYKSGHFDLDFGKVDDSPDHLFSDFYWSDENRTVRWLEPSNGAAFAVYHLE